MNIENGAVGVSEVLQKHAKTLQSLQFNDCLVSAADLNQMRGMSLLRLDSIQLTWQHPKPCLVDEAQLLSYLKGVAGHCITERGDLALLEEDKAEAAIIVTSKGRNVWEPLNYNIEDSGDHPALRFLLGL